MNWISYVKDYQSKNNISFKKAMKEAGPSYRKMKESKGKVNKKIKIIKDKKEPVKKKVIKIKKDKKEPVKKKVIKINKEISKTPEGYMNPDRLIGEGLKLLISNDKDKKKRGVKQIKIIKSGKYLSDSKGIRSPNYTLEKFVGGSFLIKSQENNIFKEYLFNEKGESIDKKEPVKKKVIKIKKAKARREAKKYDFNFMKKIKFTNNSSENDRLTENAIRKNFKKIEIKKLCDTLYHNKNSKEFFKMTQNLENESFEAIVESIILEICEEYDFEEKEKK